MLLQQLGDCCDAADPEDLFRKTRLVCNSWNAATNSVKRHWKARHACTAVQLVATFPNLTNIDLASAGPHNLDELAPILRLSGLQSLVLNPNPVRVPSDASRALEEAAGLQSLKISLVGAAATFSFARLTKLTLLHLDGCSGWEDNSDATAESVLAQAATLPQLRELRLTAMALSTVACASLSQLSQLQCVCFETIFHREYDLPTVSAILKALCKLEGLKELSYTGTMSSTRQQVDYAPVSSVSKLMCLTKLMFTGHALAPAKLAMLKPLNKLQALEDLSLVHCCLETIGDAHALANLKGLTTLKLQQCVYGTSMSRNLVPFVTALTGLTALRHFNEYSGPSLLDDDVFPLTALTNLHLLHMAAEISQSAEDNLRQQLPVLTDFCAQRFSRMDMIWAGLKALGGRQLSEDFEEDKFHIWGTHGWELPYPHILGLDYLDTGSDFASDEDM